MQMRAVRYHGPGQPFRLEQVPLPEPGPGEVRVRIAAAGVCHTELHFESGLLNLGVAPLTMGHEIAGTVDAVGPRVTSCRPGDRVIVYYYAGCGTCEWCRRGDENLCGQLRAEYGFFHDGGYAEAIVIPERNAVPLPPHVSFEAAAPIGCGVTTAIHAAGLARLVPGETVVVYGIGAVGFGLVQVARLRGARVVGVGRSPAKLARARELGAELVINARETQDVAGAVQEFTRGRGADVVFELVATRATMGAAAGMLAKRGRLVFIGYSEDRFDVHPIDLVIREATVTASVGNTLGELEEAVQLVADGTIRTVVDHTLPLERWQEGLDALRRGEVVGRVVLRPGPSG
ncbi:MAG TPA: alcohol dehydrogenase catalytic domain-containing protein [Gemmatimonadales bacterium]|nr:alcohol dehydrogenase catalytic domain-containing protein [Gemmatimonadales bacterium]